MSNQAIINATKPIILTCLFLFIAKVSVANPKTYPTTIKSAILYQNQAHVTAAASVTVEAGTQALRFSGFGNTIRPNSIQVRGKGNFTIITVNQDFNFLQQGSKAAIVKQIKDSLNILEKSVRALTSQIEVCNKEDAFLQANFVIKGQGNLTPLEIQKAAEFFNQRFTENANKTVQLNQKIEAIRAHILRLSEQLKLYESGRLKPEAVIEVTIKCTQPTRAEFEFQFLVDQAGWTPNYDLRVQEGASNMQLQLKANAYQNTGLDWEKVNLRFSTGNPVFTGQRPELTTYYLDFLQPVMAYKRSRIGRNAAYMAAGAPPMLKSEEAMAMQDAQTVEDYVSTEDRGLETEFVIEMPVSLPSTITSRDLDLKTSELPVSFQHVAVPKLSSQVYFLANTTGWEKEDLMAGRANIYYDGAFVGSTFINPNQNTDTVQISLGVDNKVSIKRERNLYQEKNLFGNRKTDTYTISITVKNNRKSPINLRLEDQYPISQNESLKVDIKETGGAKREEAEGKLIWNLNIKPAEQVTKTFKFAVQYPNDKKLAPIY